MALDTLIAFQDEIISSTEFKNHQAGWLKIATERPITIVHKGNSIVLTNRLFIRELNNRLMYTYLVMSFYRKYRENQTGKDSALSWASYLRKNDREQFVEELIDAFEKSYETGNWDIIRETLDDWKATAEVESDATLSKALLAEEHPSKYVEVED
jgi:hypothetical protein